jgi:predicted PurR-regulated permease PerM
MTPGKQADIVRTTLAVLFIGILVTSSFWILRPFLTALVWAAMIVITTWPLMLGVQKRLLGKRWLAVTVMTALLLLLLIVPLTLSIVSIVDRSDQIIDWSKSLATLQIPQPPEWLQQLPVVGPKLAAQWQQLATIGQGELSQRLAPHARGIARWLVSQAGNLGMMIVQFLLTAIISAVLFTTGEKAAAGILLFARKLSGRYGEEAAIIAGKTVRGVSLGVVVTALIQSFFGGLGLLVAGIPAAMILTAVIFILCVAQLGPALVLLPVTGWLYYNDQPVWGTAMIVWTLLVGTMDNFIRPVLIRKGADLPLLLIFAGVIGGLISFGVIGLFIGPVMLAVTYNLLQAWVMLVEPEREQLPPEDIPPN